MLWMQDLHKKYNQDQMKQPHGSKYPQLTHPFANKTMFWRANTTGRQTFVIPAKDLNSIRQNQVVVVVTTEK
jgi:hypothetical protein